MLRIILILINAGVINISFLLSFLLRYGWPLPARNLHPYKESCLLLTFLFLLSFAVCGMYRRRYPGWWNLFVHTAKGVSLGSVMAFLTLYVFRERWAPFPTTVLLLNILLGLLLLFTVNGAILRMCNRIRKKTVILGSDYPANFYTIHPSGNITSITSTTELLDYPDIDEVIICKNIENTVQFNLLVYLLLRLKVSVLFSPVLYAKMLSEYIKDEQSPRYLTTFMGQKNDFEEFLIRAIDIVCSVLLFILFIPIMLPLSGLMLLASGTPLIYKQKRIAKDGHIFTLLKFRTMKNDAEKKTGPVLASENDSRITRIGHFMRRCRFDEIPQLWNVLRGEMSLVGPRPERPFFIQRHKTLQGIRLAVKPGLTGLAQIRGAYDLHPKHKIKYDYLYIQRRSLSLNLYILAMTIPVVLLKKGR